MDNRNVYEWGKQAAMREQEQHDYPQAWQMDALMEMRDAWERCPSNAYRWIDR